MGNSGSSITSQAKVAWNGKLEVTRTWEVKSVTPKMMTWWFTHRKNKERYKLWHADHIDFRVLYKPEKGHIGSVYYEKQKVGNAVHKITAVVLGVSDTTYTQLIHHPLYTTVIYSEFEATPTGTIVHDTFIVVSDNRVFGRFWNFMTRKFLYTEKSRAAHGPHAAVERENLSNSLPKLYAEFADKED